MPKTARASARPVINQTISLPEPEHPEEPQAPQESFWETISAISEESWDNEYFIYLYRDNPRSNTKGSGYIEKLTQSFDIDWVKHKYGGYDYRALLCRDNRVIKSVQFSIDAPPKSIGVEFTPTAAPAPTNDAFQAQILNVISEQGRQTQSLLQKLIENIQQPKAEHNSSREDMTLKGVIDILTSQVPKAKDPLELLAQIKNLIPPEKDPIEILVRAKELFGGSGAGNTLLGQVDELLGVVEKLGGAVGGKAPSVAVTIATSLVEKAPEILAAASTIMDKWNAITHNNRVAREMQFRTAMALAQREAPPGTPRVSTTDGTSVFPGVSVPSTSVAPAPAGAAAVAMHPGISLDVEPLNEVTDVGAPAEIIPGDAHMLDRFLKEKVVEAIEKGDDAAKILDFIEVADERLISVLEGQSPEAIAKFFSMDPILKRALTFPNWESLLEEIVQVLNEDVEPDSDQRKKPN